MHHYGVRIEPLRTTPDPAPAPAPTPAYPLQPLLHLDELWIQVAGTLCNLSCTYCFVSSGPGIDRHRLMSRAEVHSRVLEALPLGVKEFYFTGGEPFVHPELLEILEDTLAHGPCTVLTNGTLLTEARIRSLRRLSEGTRYSLEIRVSLDGASPAEHDRLRGPGAFARALDGLLRLERAGLLPIVTITRPVEHDPLAFHERALLMLRAAGLSRPRLKVIPMFLIGRERQRTRGYRGEESLRDLPAESFDPGRLQCSRCRAVTSQGVFVCPLLVDEPGGRMGDRLGDAVRPFELRHGACFTCWTTGMSCGNS